MHAVFTFLTSELVRFSDIFNTCVTPPEIQYEVILKRPEILHSMYPLEEAMERYKTARKQTAGMIKGKIKKGYRKSIEAVNDILRKELNEGKIEKIPFDEFIETSKTKPTAFTRLNLAFNEDSLSSPIRLIHDYTTYYLELGDIMIGQGTWKHD